MYSKIPRILCTHHSDNRYIHTIHERVLITNDDDTRVVEHPPTSHHVVKPRGAPCDDARGRGRVRVRVGRSVGRAPRAVCVFHPRDVLVRISRSPSRSRARPRARPRSSSSSSSPAIVSRAFGSRDERPKDRVETHHHWPLMRARGTRTMTTVMTTTRCAWMTRARSSRGVASPRARWNARR